MQFTLLLMHIKAMMCLIGSASKDAQKASSLPLTTHFEKVIWWTSFIVEGKGHNEFRLFLNCYLSIKMTTLVVEFAEYKTHEQTNRLAFYVGCQSSRLPSQ